MMDWKQAASADAALMDDFRAVCGFGGRMSGSGEDDAAMDWAETRLRAIGPDVRRSTVPYDGWRCERAGLQLLGPDGALPLACRPLLRSASTPPEGLEGLVLDLDGGRAEDFARAGDAVRGRIVLVRHEYPFSGEHLHRRRKYDMAVAAGAAGFLIANTLPGAGVLSGSSGRPRGGAGIPAAYIDAEGARILAAAAAAGGARVRLLVEGREIEASRASVGVLDLPGGREGRVVISAHMDGHDLGCSALDNATGVAVALAAARILAPRLGPDTLGLRVCFFCAEEWALTGSERYLAEMPAPERRQLKVNINLDTVAGDAGLMALISDFPGLEPLVGQAAEASGVPVGTWLPLMPNSDHANFARHGIPALRLVAGFGKPQSRVNNILSAGDLMSVIEEAEMRQALAVTAAMADAALAMSDAQLAQLAVKSA
ncbi:Arginyl aminopeptidase [Bordetella ansorpii]|uniref:Carboxypeptidase Q n=1 Tax=Bordetella ansorpii TaxID=288768 RepID=A0A157SQH7_9BORD|nr:M28 family metallopeptidase [Bordetella ansorpii]SAI72413.1 Arginyl aminopeptidase [Bordetella ansorpii]